ncbi:DNA internalization-related competence protein ComEC/Rec2 [Exiguobacterium flavidum]|uniref:DNA internalization-related competence protein ComEC/Rec2 n=1 Tax=Exiguobacterium flavidum TaxID=2184695 RepID=UPI000DF7DFA4|nr:DNA internalization-related competence protein ComEC/Rec2 [Exiguobacterium flavidum]
MPIFPLFVVALAIALKESLWVLAFVSTILVLKSFEARLFPLAGAFFLAWSALMNSDVPRIGLPAEVELLEAKVNGDRVRYVAKASGEKFILAATVADGERPYDRIGQICSVRLKELEVNARRNEGGFDEARWMRSERLLRKWEVQSFTSCRPAEGFEAEGRRNREEWLWNIERLPAREAFYVQALVFGEDRLMDTETLDRFKAFGLLHALVISGSHIAFLIFGMLYLLKRLRMTRENRIEVVLFLLPIYGWLTEWSPPVTRAIMVAFILLLASRFKKLDPVATVAWVGASQLALSPLLIYDLGFQLTVALTLFLLISIDIWKPIAFPWNLLLVSIWAQALTLFLLQRSQQTEGSIWSPLLNILVGSWIEWIILPLAFLTAVSVLFKPEPETAALLRFALDLSDGVLSKAEALPCAVSALHLLPLGVWIGAISIVILSLWHVAKHRILHAAPVLVLLLSSAIVEKIEPDRVVFLDVGQGDSTVLEKDGETFVIDAGGTISFAKRKPLRPFDPGAQIVVPYLHTRGEKRIDGLVLTHADHDHIGGVAGMLRKIEIDTVYFGAYDNRDEKRSALLRELEKEGVNIKFLKAGDQVRPWLRVLAPDGPESEENDRSIVLLADIAKKRFLLTGDAGVKTEEEWGAGDIDVLKAGHHGSSSSTGEDLIRKTAPEVIIFSVGRNNRYGHPDKDVLERVEKVGRIYRTDEDGMITCTADGCVPMLK